MKFRLDEGLYETASTSRAREWRSALLELNMDFQAGEDEASLTVLRSVEGEMSLRVERGGSEPELVVLCGRSFRRHLRDYRQVIEQLDKASSGAFGARDFETLDYAKKLVHDEAGESLQEALGLLVPISHKLARKVFTLVFLVSHSLPETVVNRHRHR